MQLSPTSSKTIKSSNLKTFMARLQSGDENFIMIDEMIQEFIEGYVSGVYGVVVMVGG